MCKYLHGYINIINWIVHFYIPLNVHFYSIIYKQDEKQFSAQREQRQIYLEDMDGKNISSLELVNTLPNGKIQTINSMKYHSRKLESEYNIPFKYHYLRHTYGTKLAVLNTPTHLLCNQMGHSSSNVTQKYYIAMSEEGIDMLLDNLDRF